MTRSLLALGALLTATTVYGQAQIAGRNLNVMAVNLDNKEVYSVTFTPPGGSTTVGNTDENNFVRPEALAFVTNATTFQLDLLMADNQRGTLYRYPGALAPQTPPNPTSATLVWNAQTAGTGPLAPNALAVDGYGNLFVTNATSGHSQTSQLWVFPIGAGGAGSFGNPILLDSNFQSKEALVEMALVPTDVANGPVGVSGGNLILLTTSRVLAYSVTYDTNGRATGYSSRTSLISFPNGSPVPGGMDFWPIGNGTANYSLLVSSSSSPVINRYYFGTTLTAAPSFYTGVGTFYRMKTLFQQGNPLVFVSELGSIVELGADANGNGTLLATVTQNVTTPQGLAVSNSFTNAASVCLQPGGCNLTGLLTHTPTGVASLTGDIVENVCTVAADPRASVVGGVWSCKVPYTPPSGYSCPQGTNCLPVNAVCPGFDDTKHMVIPETLCGRSGSSGTGFSLIRTLVDDGQFWVPSGNGKPGGYVQHELVNADGTNPPCGPGVAADGAVIWAPLLAEGTNVETPSMLDISSGCGSGKAGTSGLSVFGEGFFINEAASALNPLGGLPLPLENLAQTKYLDLTNTIDNLTRIDANHPRWKGNTANLASSVSLALWGGNQPGVPAPPPPPNPDAFGCLDQSWLDFSNAASDVYGSPQFIADLQNAANVLTDADASGGTTCQGIIDYAQANTPNAFVQTSQSPNSPSVLNPYGQLVSLLANLYYTENVRLLNNPSSGTWPLPVSVNVQPTSVTLASSTSPGSASLWWNTHGDSGCSLSSSDNAYAGVPLDGLQPPFTLSIPASDAPQGGGATTIVTYTVSCSTGPAASTVKAYVNVYPPPTLLLAQSSIAQGAGTTLTWNTNHAQGCALSSPNDAAFVAPSVPLAPTSSVGVAPQSANSYSYNLTCSNPAVTVTANLTVVAPPRLALSATAIVQGSGSTLTWNANGNTGCSWSSNDPGFAPSGASGSVNVNPAAGTYTYTYACTGPAVSSQTVTLTAVQQPTATISGSPVIQGSAATLTWSGSTSACSWSSTDGSFIAPAVATASGSASVQPTAPGSFSYTLTCPSPTTPAVATLTVNAPAPPMISVSPSSITLGNSSSLAWTINPGDVCTGSSSGTDTNAADAFSGMVGVSGSKSVIPNNTGTDIYTLTCTVPHFTQSASLTVNPSLAKIALTAVVAGDGDLDDPGTLSWSLSGGATGCVVSGSWPKFAVPQFSPFAVSASGSKKLSFKVAGTYTYTLSCTNPSTPVQTSVTIRSESF